MKCAIMQPTYLPWSGYFNLIADVDTFVFLDDVQFERQSWQSRNRILLNGKELLLAVSVKKAGLQTKLNEIELSSVAHWQKKHLSSIKSAYRKAPYAGDILDLLDACYMDEDISHLTDFNSRIIIKITELLNLRTRFIFASDLGCRGVRSAHLVEICKALDCDEYLSPRGSMEYLLEDRFEEMSGLKLSFQDYSPLPYNQFNSNEFISHLSIIDVIANHGVDFSRSYIRGESWLPKLR